ncbi:MAG: hypothetical protein P1U56_05340 [Saprospiraceae bacterium]|nr:hypothetical protein [Saprospiraceae bacterium]
MGVDERIKKLIDRYELNVSSFSKSIGLTGNVTIYKIVKGESAPSFATLLKIKAAYPEINIDWILTGEGEMIIDKRKDISWYENQLESAKEEIKWHRELVETLKIAINNQVKPEEISKKTTKVKT